MSKNKSESVYVCHSCGQTHHKWLGRCPGCQAWNALVEESIQPRRGGMPPFSPNPARASTQIAHQTESRIVLGLSELNRVLGGGIVPGSVILLGGEPGIGKSTLLMSTASHIAQMGFKTLYVSAEESIAQTRMTAERLNALHDNLFLLSETNLTFVLAQIETLRPVVLIVDSVQTVYLAELESAAGSVSQVREVAFQLIEMAKAKGIATFLVGHVTKDGAIAGPRVLEHMVDAVLYFESARTSSYRILRAHKNRFGSTNEIGVFEMRGKGLEEVHNPSAFFLAERPKGKPGSSVAVAIEGTRPLLVEIQALCVGSFFGNPRRTSVGIDGTKSALLCAVLEKRCGLNLANQDLFVNVAGGISLTETASDLPLALAIASSFSNRPISPHLACFGEIGLTGEVRGVPRVESRIAEAQKMGFTQIMIPHTSDKHMHKSEHVEVMAVKTLEEAMKRAFI